MSTGILCYNHTYVSSEPLELHDHTYIQIDGCETENTINGNISVKGQKDAVANFRCVTEPLILNDMLTQNYQFVNSSRQAPVSQDLDGLEIIPETDSRTALQKVSNVSSCRNVSRNFDTELQQYHIHFCRSCQRFLFKKESIRVMCAISRL